MKPEIIVIHHAESHDGHEVNWTAIRKWHVDHNGWRDIGYHAGVELMGTEYVSVFGRSWFMNGAHTLNYNNEALGLCIVGNFMEVAPLPAQLEKGAEICATWIRLFHIQTSQIFLHRELNQTSCPGDKFNKSEFLESYLVPKLIGTIQP